MPRGTNQKMKLYYLSQIMLQKTDDDHMLTMPQIQEALLTYGVTADRKSLYDDMEALRLMGIDVIGEKIGRNYYYHVGGKHFELAELKLLVDAIQSSRFITERKSNELIKKITSMASEYEARQLKRQVAVNGRVKTMNESIYYYVDELHRAISENKKISFVYMKWNLKKKLVPRHAESYIVSPWALTWENENYYLIAYDEKEEKLKHFRIDKIKEIEILEEKRTGRAEFKAFNLPQYIRMSFGMFSGEKRSVTIAFEDSLVGVFLDRFGREIVIQPSETPGWSQTIVEVAVSDQFLGWIFALGQKVRILGPDEVVDRFVEEAQELLKLYR